MYALGVPLENEFVANTGDTSLTGQDLNGADLRHQNLVDKILFGTDLRGADLYDARIALKCQTFDGCKLDDEQVAKLLLMIQLADINPKWQVGLRDLVRRVTGEKYFAKLARWLRLIQ